MTANADGANHKIFRLDVTVDDRQAPLVRAWILDDRGSDLEGSS